MTFAKLAAKSRKHPAYWKALAELEHDEVKAERDRYRRWLELFRERITAQKAPPIVGRFDSYYFEAIVRSDELDAALRGDEPPKVK